jgi:hypothetical protein
MRASGFSNVVKIAMKRETRNDKHSQWIDPPDDMKALAGQDLIKTPFDHFTRDLSL